MVAWLKENGMKVNSSKLDFKVLDQNKMAFPLFIRRGILPKVKEVKYLGVLFMKLGRMEREFNKAEYG